MAKARTPAAPADPQAPAPAAGRARGARTALQERVALLQLIHVGRREIAMVDDDWRAYLRAHFNGVDSSASLSIAQLRLALNHLRRLGFVRRASAGAQGQIGEEWAWVNDLPPDSGRAPYLRKLARLCDAAGIERGQQVGYCEGIVRQMSGRGRSGAGAGAVIAPLRLCSADRLLAAVQALTIHVHRVRRKGSGA